MHKTIKALHKALKVLNCLNNDRVYETAWVKGAINACEEALSQEQKPLTRDWIGTALERADKDEAFRKGLIGELAQPLSDDEIMILLNEIKYSAAEVETTFDCEIRIARAIEAYHGIGVKDAN